MANMIVVDTGKTYLSKVCMDGSKAKLDTNAKINFFTNNYTVVETTVLADLTAQTVTGIAATTLTGATDGGIDANDRDTWTWPLMTFAATSGSGLPQTLYGYYITDSAGTTLIAAQNFAIPVVITNNGDGFTIQPQFSFGSIF